MSHTLRLAKSTSQIITALFVIALGALPARAQNFVEYAAKFACGVATATTPMVQPGTYSTTINIHNPHDNLFSQQASTTFMKKAVQSLPEGQTPPPPSQFVTDTLLNDFAEEVDCNIIKSLLKITSTAFFEGYVVIIVPPTVLGNTQFTNQLDVIGIYTNSKGAMVVRPANEHIIVPGTT
jgi:hypothetical protein